MYFQEKPILYGTISVMITHQYINYLLLEVKENNSVGEWLSTYSLQQKVDDGLYRLTTISFKLFFSSSGYVMILQGYVHSLMPNWAQLGPIYECSPLRWF